MLTTPSACAYVYTKLYLFPGKLSKKLHEPSVYSKLKALVSVHKLVQRTDDSVKYALAQVIKGLREVPDKKGSNYFAMSLIEEASTAAGEPS